MFPPFVSRAESFGVAFNQFGELCRKCINIFFNPPFRTCSILVWLPVVQEIPQLRRSHRSEIVSFLGRHMLDKASATTRTERFVIFELDVLAIGQERAIRVGFLALQEAGY